MKHKQYTAAVLLIAPALLASTARNTEVGFGPSAGTAISMTFENEMEISLDEMTMLMSGQEMDGGGMSMDTTASTRLSVTDVYAEVGDGRPTKLVRTFDEIGAQTAMTGSHPMMGEMSQESEGTSELEGLSVVFTWDADEEEYSVAFADDSSGDDELLEGLEEALDMRAVLPDGEVAEGDSWEVDPQVIRTLLAPGGSTKVELESDGEGGMGGPQPSPNEFLGELEGEVTAQFTGTRAADDGRNVGAISLTIEVSSARDMADFMADMMEDMPEQPGMEMEFNSMDYEFTFEGEGVLLWDLEAGVLHSMEISGEVSQTVDTSMSISAQGRDMEMEQSMSFSGSQSASVTTEIES